MKVSGIDAVYYTVADVDKMTTFYTGPVGIRARDDVAGPARRVDPRGRQTASVSTDQKRKAWAAGAAAA